MTIWITGASSGIGEATALEFARKGCRLILSARREEALARVSERCLAAGSPHVDILPADLSKTDSLESLALLAWQISGEGIDILFLNAGISQRTKVEDTDPEMIRQIMELDYFAPVLLAKAVLPMMLSRELSGKSKVKGRIAVTTSINGRFGFPLRCAYSSAKHALYGFFETLAAEYYSQGIRVTIVCPGRVQSEISLHALDKGGVPHGKMDPGQAGGITAEKAARKIARAILKCRSEVLVGGGELAMVHIKTLFPRLCAYLTRHLKAM